MFAIDPADYLSPFLPESGFILQKMIRDCQWGGLFFWGQQIQNSQHILRESLKRSLKNREYKIQTEELGDQETG